MGYGWRAKKKGNMEKRIKEEVRTTMERKSALSFAGNGLLTAIASTHLVTRISTVSGLGKTQSGSIPPFGQSTQV